MVEKSEPENPSLDKDAFKDLPPQQRHRLHEEDDGEQPAEHQLVDGDANDSLERHETSDQLSVDVDTTKPAERQLVDWDTNDSLEQPEAPEQLSVDTDTKKPVERQLVDWDTNDSLEQPEASEQLSVDADTTESVEHQLVDSDIDDSLEQPEVVTTGDAKEHQVQEPQDANTATKLDDVIASDENSENLSPSMSDDSSVAAVDNQNQDDNSSSTQETQEKWDTSKTTFLDEEQLQINMQAKIMQMQETCETMIATNLAVEDMQQAIELLKIISNGILEKSEPKDTPPQEDGELL